MNDLLKSKYYNLIHTNDFKHYENVGKILSLIENILIDTNNNVGKGTLIEILKPLEENELSVYQAVLNDINNGVIYENSNND
jgi:hypothetical protein